MRNALTMIMSTPSPVNFVHYVSDMFTYMKLYFSIFLAVYFTKVAKGC